MLKEIHASEGPGSSAGESQVGGCRAAGDEAACGSAEQLFYVISRAYERTSVIITTNLQFENWTNVLGSERLTGALLDRLMHRVHIMEAKGEIYRLKDAKARLKRR